MALFTVTLLAFQKKIIFLKMSIIWLQLTEISLKFESSSQKLFDLNRLKIVVSKAVYCLECYCLLKNISKLFVSLINNNILSNIYNKIV
jgi:hypothetical protein